MFENFSNPPGFIARFWPGKAMDIWEDHRMRGPRTNQRSGAKPALIRALPLRCHAIKFRLLRKGIACSVNCHAAATCIKLPIRDGGTEVNSFPRNSAEGNVAPSQQTLEPAEVLFDLLAAAVGEEAAGFGVFGSAYARSFRPAWKTLALERFPHLSRRPGLLWRDRAAGGEEHRRDEQEQRKEGAKRHARNIA